MHNWKSGTGIAIGLSMGIAIGVALDNIGIGIAVGLALGVAFDATAKKKQGSDGQGGKEPDGR